LPHNGIDIDQYVLLAIYPTITFFAIGYIGRKTKLDEAIRYALQSLASIAFSVAYLIAIPNGGGMGLAIVLAIFGVVLLFIARKYSKQPKEEEPTGQSSL
jgi:hypothetical protein